MKALWILLAALPLSAAPENMTYSIRTVAGSSNVGDGRAAALAQLNDAQGVAADQAGSVYIADTANHRVRKVRADGIIETLAGQGVPGFAGDGGPARQALLNAPYGVAADAAGNVYIADLANRRVRKVSPDGVISTVAGSGQSGSAGDGGLAVEAALGAPRNVAVDAAGALYIADFAEHRVRKVANGVISTVAGNGRAGAEGDGGPAALAALAHPAGLALDPAGALYIAESGNHRVRRVASGTISTLAASAGGIPLATPTGVAAGPGGALYIADSMNRRVLMRTAGGDLLIVAGSGSSGALKSLDTARDVAADGQGNLFIADGRKIRRLGANGAGDVLAGDGGFGFRGENEPATNAVLNTPSGIAVAGDGSLYIADERNHRVRKVTPAGVIATVAGTGAPGFGYDGPTALATPVDAPTGITVDPGGVAWFAESGGHRVRKLTPAGSMITAAGKNPGGADGDRVEALMARLRAPAFALLDPQGILHISDSGSHRVRKLLPGGLLVTVAGSGARGFSGDGGPAVLAELDTPRGLAFDASGTLYIADSGNHRVRKVTPDGRISTLGEGAPLNRPAAVAVGSEQNVYVADTQNHRVVELHADGSLATLAGSPGISGFTGDGGPAAAALLNAPSALALDAAGNLYVADTGNHRIRLLSPGGAPPVVDPLEAPPVTVRVLNSASLAAGPVAPGELVYLVGPDIGPPDSTSSATAPGVEVLFDGQAAPVLGALPNRVTAQAPYGIAARVQTVIEVKRDGVRRGTATAEVALAAPGIFVREGGAALAANQDGGINAPANPAPAGSVISLFATGAGQTTPPSVEGQPASDATARPLLPIAVAIGGEAAEVLFAGPAPGLVGLLQVNARVPPLRSGPASVVLFAGGTRSQDGVWMSVR